MGLNVEVGSGGYSQKGAAERGSAVVQNVEIEREVEYSSSQDSSNSGPLELIILLGQDPPGPDILVALVPPETPGRIPIGPDSVTCPPSISHWLEISITS